ncbi:uncharacterized protein LOC110676816 [Aedes aegypti]|uniref:Uncharacterized protein n=1 Tax=Aedes aegypti TaxID=7159 RepID=A0A6I8U3R4_AEDAE|nr:uncharacterized protein LOC110676816 [Aedes aegypti]
MFPTPIIILLIVAAGPALSKIEPPLGCVHIENIAYRRFLFAGQYQSGYDRNVNFDNWERVVDKEWVLERSGKEYRIYTVKYQIAPMYLLVNRATQVDNNRRQVHLSAFVNSTREMSWKIEDQKNGYFAIQNKDLKEYLYAGEQKYDIPYGCLRPYENWKTNSSICRSVGQVFTWKGTNPKKLGHEFQWKIHSC